MLSSSCLCDFILIEVLYVFFIRLEHGHLRTVDSIGFSAQFLALWYQGYRVEGEV